MHEQQRSALALAGVGGCLCLAAGIMLTAPRDLATPSVDARPVALAEGLPRVATPSWSAVSVTRVPPPRASRVHAVGVAPAGPMPVAESASARIDRPSVAPEPEEVAAPRVLRGVRSAMPVVLRAPRANGLDVVVARSPARERSAVTSALVTAGVHVGDSVKTIGRTLRKVF